MDMKKHGYWVGMGALVLVAAGLFYFLVVDGVWAENAKKERTLKSAINSLKKYVKVSSDEVGDPEKGLPVQKMIEYWEAKQKGLSGERSEVLRSFREIDKKLERIVGGSSVAPARFVAELQDKMQQFDKRYQVILPEGKTFQEVAPIFGGAPPADITEIPFAQKKFYLAQALAEAALAGGAQTLVAIEFGEEPPKLKEEQLQEFGAQRIGATLIVDMPLSGAAETKERATARRRALERLRQPTSMPAGLQALISAVLKHQELVFQIGSINVRKTAFDNPEFAPWKVFPEKKQGFSGTREAKTFDQAVYVATRDTQDPQSKGEVPELTEPVTRVVLKAYVLDFHFPEEIEEQE